LDGCRLSHPEPGQDLRRQYAGPYASLMAWMRLDATYHRWRFNLKTGACREAPLSDLISEFPMINSRRFGVATRYSYHVSFADTDTVLFNGLVKYDSHTGKVERYLFDEGHYGSESPFASRDRAVTQTSADSEDDGYVVSFVSIPAERRAELQVFDARDLAAGPLCRALIPHHIASGFHSCWIASNRLAPGAW
jgi:carotenoid cleavage dioxygenase